MKRFWWIALLFLTPRAHAQGTQIASYPSDPPTCNSARGLLEYNTTTQTLKVCGPSLNSWSALSAGGGTIGGTVTASHLTFGSAGNTVGDVAGSAVTAGTGAISLTAGATTTTPLLINSFSTSQTANLLDINNQSGGTPNAPLVVRGTGFGSFSPGHVTSLVNFQQDSMAAAARAWVITNRQATGSGSALSTLEAFVDNSGEPFIIGGNMVGDGSGNYGGFQFDNIAWGIGVAAVQGATGNPVMVPFGVVQGVVGATADLTDFRNSTGIVTSLDKNGLINTIQGIEINPSQVAGPAGAAATQVLYTPGTPGGAPLTATSNGNNGSTIFLLTGNGSNGGATSGNGGNGGAWTLGGGNGGNGVGGNSNGGAGDLFQIGLGSGGNGVGTGAGGNAATFNIALGGTGNGGSAGASGGNGGTGADVIFWGGGGANGGAAPAGTGGRGGNIVFNLGGGGTGGVANGIKGQFEVVSQITTQAQTTGAMTILDQWNTSGVVDAALKVNVTTDTASGAGSMLLDLQDANVSKFSVDKTGTAKLWGSTSGAALIGAAATAGTPAQINLPTATGSANAVLTTDGNSPQQSSWQVPTSLSCTYQGPLAPVTGTGAAATYYTCSVPVLGAGQGIAITVVSQETTGTGNITFTVQFGGSSTTGSTPTGGANEIEIIKCLLMNNPGSTTAQTVSTQYIDSVSGKDSMSVDTFAINTGSAQTLNIQFNVANTTAITPKQFLVQIVK